ncbi:hypothetical protein B0H21DRAFT_19572 [Amylocystis lapponica]|nr:hypothetical protein B0H21DRAFT_19572 [Amylocystis lapponica]
MQDVWPPEMSNSPPRTCRMRRFHLVADVPLLIGHLFLVFSSIPHTHEMRYPSLHQGPSLACFSVLFPPFHPLIACPPLRAPLQLRYRTTTYKRSPSLRVTLYSTLILASVLASIT